MESITKQIESYRELLQIQFNQALKSGQGHHFIPWVKFSTSMNRELRSKKSDHKINSQEYIALYCMLILWGNRNRYLDAKLRGPITRILKCKPLDKAKKEIDKLLDNSLEAIKKKKIDHESQNKRRSYDLTRS